MQHKVVFLCDYSEALRSTVLPLAGALAGEGTYQPHVLVERATDSMLDMCRATEIEFTIRSRAAAQNRDQRPVPPPPGTLAWSANLVVNVAKSRQRIRKLRVDALVAGQERRLVFGEVEPIVEDRPQHAVGKADVELVVVLARQRQGDRRHVAVGLDARRHAGAGPDHIPVPAEPDAAATAQRIGQSY